MNLPLFFAGLACLPATFYETRRGTLLLSLLFIISLVIAALIINRKLKITIIRFYSSFVFGSLLSEIALMVYCGLEYGYNNGYGFKFNLSLAVMEFLAIAVVGCISIATLNQLLKRITSRTSGQ
jgi:hypothetical protein